MMLWLQVLEVVLYVLEMPEGVHCAPICMQDAVEAVCCALEAMDGCVLFVGGAGGDALHAAPYAGGRGGRTICTEGLLNPLKTEFDLLSDIFTYFSAI